MPQPKTSKQPRKRPHLFTHWTWRTVLWTAMASALIAWGTWEVSNQREFHPLFVPIFLLGLSIAGIACWDIRLNRNAGPR